LDINTKQGLDSLKTISTLKCEDTLRKEPFCGQGTNLEKEPDNHLKDKLNLDNNFISDCRFDRTISQTR